MLHFIICLMIGGKSDGIFDFDFMHLFIFRNRLSHMCHSFISALHGSGGQEKPARVYQKLVMRRQYSYAIDGVEK